VLSLNEISAQEYFEKLKNSKKIITDTELLQSYNICTQLFKKFEKTRQLEAIRKLMFLMDSIIKERQLIKLGINQFVYKDDILKYEDLLNNNEDKTASKDVVIVDIEGYEREIPDDIVKLVTKTNNIFSNFYVLFTDYTNNRKSLLERQKKYTDPILFGAFIDEKSHSIDDRFYVLGDWEDQFCDLTLEKMVSQMTAVKMDSPVHEITTPQTPSELRNEFYKLQKNKSFKRDESSEQGPTYKIVEHKLGIAKMKDIFVQKHHKKNSQ